MLTDEQLILLEQLTYLGPDTYGAAGLSYPGPGTSVQEMVGLFTEKSLKKLSEAGAIGYTEGSEWAAIIRAIQNDSELMRLQVTDYSDEQRIYCFADPSSPKDLIVAFQGTTGGDEWADNVEGLDEADTERQKAALDFIENLDSENITVVGHSKGGNKAQYVAITSDKVKYCVSMDGQGFSQEFLDKYWAEIERNANKIKSYSVSNDYVNILMFPIPGVDPIYCQGGNEPGLKNHSASSFFHYEQDENGQWHIKTNSNNQANIVKTSQDEIMAYLHEFTCFIINEMPDSDKAKVIKYLKVLLAVAMDEHYRIEIDGVIYTSKPGKGEKGVIDLLGLDLKTGTMIIAYIVKYIETYDLSEEQIRQLLGAFGLEKELDRLLDEIEKTVRKYHLEWIVKDSGGLLMFCMRLVLGQITDGKDDPIIEWILSKFANSWLTNVFGNHVDAGELWANIQKEYNKIGDVDPGRANQDGKIRAGVVLNFTKDAYSVLMNTISSVEKQTFESVAGWKNYASEEWYGPLSVGIAVNGITSYFSYLSDINANCKTQIERIFTNVNSVDKRYSDKISTIIEEIRIARNAILRYGDNIVIV